MNFENFTTSTFETKVQKFQKLTSYFIKKGNRSILETQVRSFLKNKSNMKLKKKALIIQANNRIGNSMPYIYLHTRVFKRKKRT